ncbi:MAG: Na/Pi cotransporter family protein [Planctomycetes bacterium]|nr:Na/Pi cotransporter family protein [Planctomycetota bacterium]
MIKEMIFGIAGGLGLFLFGMGIMSNGLKQIAGQKLKDILGALTKHRVLGVLMGALTTALIQSSSATTVMIVGFVNAGLLTLRQALCVVLGANIGTTFTAWLVSTFGLGGLKITAYALPAIGIGFLLRTVGKTRKIKSFGNILLGFGILFIGIGFMKDAFSPLRDSTEVQRALIWLGQNPLLAVLAGTVLTMLLQSSSASIMIVQVLAFQGAFGTDWHVAAQVAIPFILGDNIGTTITAELAALQTSRNSKRVARGHTMFNVIGVAYMLPLVWTGLFGNIVEWITPFELSQSTIMIHIAVAHSMFNVFNAIVFTAIVGWLEAIVTKIVPITEDELAQQPVALEKHLLNTPVIALEQTKREIIRMAKTAKKALRFSISGIIDDNRKELGSVREIEDFVDVFQLEITSYLSALSRRHLSDEVSIELPVLLHTVNDLERISDHAVNIVEIAERKIEQKLPFSDSAMTEAEQLRKEIDQMFDNVITALENNDIEAAKSAALTNENNLNKMQMEFRRSHVQRMTESVCTAETGLIFIDLVDNIEKIGDHLTNIAQAIIGGLQWEGVKPKVVDIS